MQLECMMISLRDIRWTITDCSIFPRQFLVLYCFKCNSASFGRYSTVFLFPNMPPKHVEQDQIDAKWIGKS